VLALVIVNDAAGEGNLAAEAVDHVVGRCDVLLQRCRISDQLEDRARLVNVADSVVAQQLRRVWRMSLGLNVGRMANARISPVCTSCTTTVPLAAWVRCIAWSSACFCHD